ncbi:spermidine hydroxycinnamoyl transferase-like [Cucurbita moschata]|uniref:Spermidine hydroxycinnamoyl transferase-like n=1 Tax=Cucurbita moschata TaxID=3662 RepID=A0A6J1GCX6_CUCMO|nr:spermidine hydroxycinnamoyl transferase-like [Cucurbita moschata]
MASLTIHSSTTVFPAHPTPIATLSFSESDQIKPWTHSPTVYVYRSPTVTTSAVVESLRNSLSQMLVPYYPLAGRLHWIGGGRLELHCCSAGAQLIEASSTATLDDYGDFSPTDALRELAPKVDYSTPIEELPVFLIQVTRFSCGGIVIGTGLSHILVDGVSAITFINSWASIARKDKTVESIVQPFHDRSVLQPQKPLRPPRFDHREYDNPPFLLGCSDAKEERKKESIPTLLKLSKEQVEKLKKRANSNIVNQLDELPSRPYTRYESIAGHMWVCACKARSTGDKSQPTMVRVAVDVRRRLGTPVPNNFTGNSTLVAVTPKCQFGDLISQPLSYAAGKIREGTWKITDEYARSALDFLASQEDISWVRTSYHTKVKVEAPFWGNPNLSLGSWMSLPLYEADFGWGKPCYVGPATLNADGKSFIMPAPDNDGGLIIAIRLQKKHMDDFKRHFYEDL